MAAGVGTRLRPLTERWPKPVLPIDGRPVVVTLVHELAAAGCERIVVVTGHLAEQVEALLEPLPYDLRFVRQPPGLGSADAVLRAQRHAAVPGRRRPTPSFGRGRPRPLRRAQARARRRDRGCTGDGRPPLWWSARASTRYLDPLPGNAAVRARSTCSSDAIDAGAEVSAIQIGRTRDLTSPLTSCARTSRT